MELSMVKDGKVSRVTWVAAVKDREGKIWEVPSTFAAQQLAGLILSIDNAIYLEGETFNIESALDEYIAEQSTRKSPRLVEVTEWAYPFSYADGRVSFQTFITTTEVPVEADPVEANTFINYVGARHNRMIKDYSKKAA